MMRRLALAGIACFALAAAVPVRAAQEVPGRLVVELTDAGARALHAGTLQLPLPPGGEAMHPRIEPLFTSRTGPLARFALVTFDPPAGADATPLNREWLESFGRSSRVVRGGPDYVMPMAALPDDPYFPGGGMPSRQFHLYNPSGLSERVARAWPFVPADREVIVGVIDSGVYWRHPDLGGGGSPPDARVFWHNALEVNGVPGVDDDANGKVDDFIGWDFVEGGIFPSLDWTYRPISGEDGSVPDNDPADFAGHGTEVAGFINALTDNGVGIAGAAPAARIMVLRVGWLSNSGRSLVYMTYCAQAIEYAALNGARVINCSWDSIGDAQYGLAAALDVAINTYGVVVVGSAGNDNTSLTASQYLSSREDCLGVAGVLESGVKPGGGSSGSNFGTWVDLAGFYQGPPTTAYLYGTLQPTYANPSGTSFASPQVAAAAALVRAVAPQASASAVRTWLKATGQSVAAMNPSYATLLGSGLVDAASAVQAAGGGWDVAARARALTPYAAGNPEAAPNFLFVGPTSLKALATATGEPAPGLIDSVASIAADGEMPLVLAWPGTSAPMAVWREGTSLRGMSFTGSAPAGWPVTIDADAGQPAANPSATEPEIFVPSAQGLLIVRYNGAAEPVTERLSFACSSVAVGELDGYGPVDVAAVDSFGALHIYLRGYEEGTTHWDDAPSMNPLPPVITSGGVVLVACSDPSSPSTHQWLRRYRLAGDPGVPTFAMDVVFIDAPPFTALSLGGFASDQRMVAVAADSAGGIHVIEPGTEPIVQFVSAGGPIAGEVLCADIDGDWDSDLIALRRDGTLFAWRADLTPLPGFPRRFPFGAIETPMVADAEGVRYVVVADTAGGLWSLPMGPAGRPAPWPTARGEAARRAYLDSGRATPVEPGVNSLKWEWKVVGGVLCWSGAGLDTYVQLRVRDVDSDDVVWSGDPRDSRCLSFASINAACTLAVDGLHRIDGWRVLGSLEIGPPGLRVAAPEPNPSLSGASIAWNGASGKVHVTIVDVRGRVMREVDFSEPEGIFFWDGNDGGGRVAPAGIYFARVSDDTRSVARRLVRLR